MNSWTKDNMNESERKAPSVADLKRLKDFLSWAKENEIQLHEVDFGTIRLTLTDLELMQEEVVTSPDYKGKEVPTPASMYDQILQRRGITPNE